MALDRADLAAPTCPTLPTRRHVVQPLLLPTQPGYVDQARATGLVHDPVRAGKLLDEAGWELESGRRVKDGQPLVLTFRTAEATTLAAAEFEVLADQLAAVGVPRCAVTADADLTPRTVPSARSRWRACPRRRASAPRPRRPGRPRWRTEVDPVRRADQATQLARLLWQEVVAIPLYQEPQFVAVRNGLANLGAPGYATTDWEDVGWTS